MALMQVLLPMASCCSSGEERVLAEGDGAKTCVCSEHQGWHARPLLLQQRIALQAQALLVLASVACVGTGEHPDCVGTTLLSSALIPFWSCPAGRHCDQPLVLPNTGAAAALFSGLFRGCFGRGLNPASLHLSQCIISRALCPYICEVQRWRVLIAVFVVPPWP